MTTLSVFMDVPLAQKLEGSLLKTYKQDSCPNKIFLAFRVCQTSKGQPWVSSVVPKIRLQIAQDPSLNYEYLPVNGMRSFTEAALKLLFGKHNQVIVENRVGGVHIVGDNGAFQLGAQFLKIWRKDSQIVYIISSKKEPYGLVFQDMGFTVREYSFWDSKQLCMDANVLLNVAEQAPHDCIFVIGNICDCNLTQSQWAMLMANLKNKRIFLFFDISNQGLSTGDLEKDTGFLQYFVSQGFEFFCSQSLSKNFGIYDEGVGILVVVALNNELLLCVLSQLMKLTQALWLNPPTTGARIITSILCNPALQEEWKQSLKGLVENIMLIKEKVKEKLRLLGTPGSWDHITDQNGSHSYLGLNIQQVEYLIKKKHIYLPKNSRINFTCINAHNIDYITQSINEAVLSTKGLD
ncbi:putative aspartate aminotransferase, cytoplasmic 2 isoform X2 [Mustela lutreola]|uniref:Putative aspartate aminotransferase, cytoplasmic 2 n=1 Tax=Mustela putorius furo TaxID=9669 RepID=M3YEU7_MUSPF|nr:putative aspartate aminotransferase, cytoplasmic 2 isoform X6 [Mustela putorius furo]XP_059012097.1 putative aspartate aminotransferase, cytoplasmic 2 isoform X2 [Mustela lutreola]